MDVTEPAEILRLLGRREPASFSLVSGGADAKIWRVQQSDCVYALRLLRPEQSTQAAREQLAMECATSAGIPVPRVLATGVWNEHPAMLLEWANGKTLGSQLLSKLDDPQRAEVFGMRFGEVQAAIHRIPPPNGLRMGWIGWPVDNAELVEHFAKVKLRKPALLHLDFHALNVLVGGGEITAVLDWANAHAGDPRADLARTLSIVRLAPTPEHLDSAEVEITFGSFERGWRRGYEESGGSFDGLEPFCWWAGKAMDHDLAPRAGRSDLPWLTPCYLARIRRWTAEWRETSRAVS